MLEHVIAEMVAKYGLHTPALWPHLQAEARQRRIARAIPIARDVIATVLEGAPAPRVLDAAHLTRQRTFSERVFGPGPRTKGIISHIRKELEEIEAKPDDLGEWIDVAILALDGAWRAGHDPQAIIDAIVAKQERNERRVWPDWRTASPDEAIEHDRVFDRVSDRVSEGMEGVQG